MAHIPQPIVPVIGDPANPNGARRKSQQMGRLRAGRRDDDIWAVAPNQLEELHESLREPRDGGRIRNDVVRPPPGFAARLQRAVSVADEGLVLRTETCAQIARSDDPLRVVVVVRARDLARQHGCADAGGLECAPEPCRAVGGHGIDRRVEVRHQEDVADREVRRLPVVGRHAVCGGADPWQAAHDTGLCSGTDSVAPYRYLRPEPAFT